MEAAGDKFKKSSSRFLLKLFLSEISFDLNELNLFF